MTGCHGFRGVRSRDCGICAWMQIEDDRIVHADFYVQDELWDEVCPDDEVREWVVGGPKFREGKFVICVGCFEKRLGRRLRREDFTTEPDFLFGTPPSRRLRSRWEVSAARGLEPPRDRSHRKPTRTRPIPSR